jgi:nucleotide-binding universal stress UspA family protein
MGVLGGIMATTTLSTAVHFSNILFTTDFSDYSRQALPYVTDLARKFSSKIHLCHVVTPSQLVISAPEAAPFLYDAQCQTGRDELEDLSRSPEMRGLSVNTILGTGILEDALRKEIADHRIDLIVVATHGRTGFRRLVLGSSAEVICRIADCPVLTVGPEVASRNEERFRRILVPADLSGQGTEIMPCVRQIAREFGASITFLHVIPVTGATLTNPGSAADDARRALEETFGRDFAGFRTEFLIEFGDAADAILRAASENRIDLIAMGVKSGPAMGGHFRSSTAYRVMTGAHCPVLTCR